MKKLSLSSKIIIGMVLGVATGLFWGEKVGWLDIAGTVFIKLLQMAIVPYIVASLTVGIGSLTFDQARNVAAKVGILLLITWGLGLLVFLAMPLAFPSLTTAGFFSDVTIAAPPEVNYYDVYIPANPFKSLSANYIPAVVLFCLAVGVALISIKEKETILAPLRVLSSALTKVTNGIVQLMPYGVFAISASTAGTMGGEEFEKLQVYFFTHTVAALLLSFVLLPFFLTAFTPFRYRDVVGISKDALLTAFVTGNLFVVLPVLTENAKELFKKYELTRDNTDNYVDVVIPVTFNFPNLGKLSCLLFILFAVWFSGGKLNVADYPFFIVGGVLSMFGSVNVAVPFLLDGLRIPQDLFQLFMVSSIVSSKFSTLLAGMHLLILTMGATSLLTGVVKIQWKRLCWAGGMVTLVILLTLLGSRFFLQTVVKPSYTLDEVLLNMQVGDRRQAGEIKEDNDLANVVGDDSGIETILTRGVLRVGVKLDEVPFSYYNANGDLVGFDVELMERLADQLGVKVEFFELNYDELGPAVNQGKVDIAVSSLNITTRRLAKVAFTDPVLELTNSFVVRDYRKEEFSTLEKLRQHEPFTVAVSDDHPELKKIIESSPHVTFVAIESNRAFFEQEEGSYDGLLISLEEGMAWSVLYPEYTAALFTEKKIPVGYVVAPGNLELQSFLNSWLAMERSMKSIDRLFNYWFKAENAVPEAPRWCIARDVLHWVE